MDRRTALTRLAIAAGGIAAAVAAIPFVRYFYPSERAKALGSPVSVDLSTIGPGQLVSVIWRGQPVLVMRRTPDQIAALAKTTDSVLDHYDPSDWQPKYVNATHRSRKSEFLVVLGNCTHLGCVPNLDVDVGRDLLGKWWPGGFHCPCHDSIYDHAGRVVNGPAPRNLRVPPHWFVSDAELIVGEDEASA